MNSKYLSPFAYMRKLESIFIRIAAYPVSFFDGFINRGCKKKCICKPIFIVGAPRTSSTILYQALTNYYDIKYIDNLACKWHRNLFFGMWLSQRRFGEKPHDNFKAHFGNTLGFGGHAPSECGGFWYRWLPKERHFIDSHEVTNKMLHQIRIEINGILEYFGKPLIFKNLNAGQRLRLLVKVFPNARFIYVRRDPRFVVRSIINARKKLNVKEGEWWSIKPYNYETLLPLKEHEMCSAQVYYLQKQIEEDLRLFPTENVKIVNAKNFSFEMIEDLGEWMGVKKRIGGSLPEFRKDDLLEMQGNKHKLLKDTIQKYPFDKELFV